MPDTAPIDPKNKPDAKSLAWERQSAMWDLTTTLMGGTAAMREAGQTYLPKEAAEPEPSYAVRLARSFLYSAFKDTVRRFVAKPFSRTVVLKNPLPERLSVLEHDMDLEGTTLTEFLRDLLWAGITDGMVHVIAQYPNLPAGATRADELKLQPYFEIVRAADLIGFKTSENDQGTRRLESVRVMRSRVKPDGSYGERCEYTVTEYTADGWQRWVQDQNDPDKWLSDGEGVHTFGSVPLLTFYTNRIGLLEAESPLIDLAWKNVEHWQSSSDQSNILRFSRMAMLFIKGRSEEEKETPLTFAANQILQLVNTDGDAKFIEHSGKAIGAGRDNVADLEEQMEVLGLRPQVSRSGDATATGKVIEESKAHTDVQAWIIALEMFGRELFEAALKWIEPNTALPENVEIDINDEFVLSQSDSADMQNLIKLRAMGDIDRLTMLHEARRRGLLDEDLDIEEINSKVEEEVGMSTADNVDPLTGEPVDPNTGLPVSQGDPLNA